MQVLITGVAGFIGYHLARSLLRDDIEVVGIDHLTPYYDVTLKEARLNALYTLPGFHFLRGDITERELFQQIHVHYPQVTHIVHLAAEPGVRPSSRRLEDYVHANIGGQLQVLEYARSLDGLEHLIYASSSSVYGGQDKQPFHEDDEADMPLSFYGVTKRSGELMATQYAAEHGLPVTGLRLFTSYGPYGRPDMAYYRFTQALYADEPITLYHRGQMRRDFTYIDDTIAGIRAALLAGQAGHRLINLGNSRPETVAHLLALLEEATGRKARITHAKRQEIEPLATYADIGRARRLLGFAPKTPLKDGIGRFVAWFCDYHGVS